jgi:hypothetical protein
LLARRRFLSSTTDERGAPDSSSIP